MHIESNKKSIGRPVSEVYLFLADFRNFEHLMPGQVQNYSATADDCGFEISGMGEISLRMAERIENARVRTESTGDKGIRFSLTINLAAESESSSWATATLDAELSAVMEMIAKTPLNNFINMLVDKLKEVMEAR